MEILKNWLWVYPAIVMTSWTVLTLAVAWTARLNQAIPAAFGLHPMLMQLNPKDEILYSRPSVLMALAYLGIGIVPVVCALVLAAVLWVMLAYQYERAEKFLRKRFPR